MIEIIGGQLTQWDVSREVKVTDSTATHVHLANRGDSKAVIMHLDSGQTKIPDFLLQTGKVLLVYAVVNGVTIESKSFPVQNRAKPENYTYEEDSRNYIDQLIRAAENATAAAQNAAQDILEAKEAGEFNGPKGDRGEKGDPGEPGPTGEKGYTPVRGIDYYTEVDKDELLDELWMREKLSLGEIQGYTFGTKSLTVINYSSSYTFSEKIKVEGEEIVLANPITEVFTHSNGFNELIGKYFQASGTTYFVPLSCTMHENTIYNTPNIPSGLGMVGQVQIVSFEENDGTSGKDGISATHKWEGSVLTITSASGTSSADLKGEKGDKGDPGEKGQDGYTPAKGTDYYTQADKEEMTNMVLAALPTWTGGSY